MGFAPPMSNIPLWSLREEFRLTCECAQSADFSIALKRNVRPIVTPILDWHGSEADLVSLLVQRSIMGVESYTIGAAWSTLINLGEMTQELNEKVRNPFSIRRGSGTASAYYHELPSLIHHDLSLFSVDPGFWIELKSFYKNVRNPLFHGSQFAGDYATNAAEPFRVVGEIYQWLDQWYDSGWSPGQRVSVVIKPSA